MNKKLLKKLFRYAFGFKAQIITSILIVVGYAIFANFVPIYLSYLFDQHLPKAMTEAKLFQFSFYATLYFVLVCASGLLSAFARTYSQNVAHKIVTKMRLDLFEHIQNVPVSYYDKTPIGSIVSKLTGDTKFVKFFYQTLMYDTLFSIVSIINVVVILLNIDQQLSVIMFVLVVLIVIVMIDFVLKQIKYMYLRRKVNSAYNVAINENIEGNIMIQVFNQNDNFLNSFEKVNQDLYNINMKYTKLESYSGNTFSRFIESLAISALLIYVSYQFVFNHTLMQSGLIVVFISYITAVIWNIQNSAYSFSTLGRAFQAAKHAFELLSEPTIEVQPHQLDIRGEVEFKHVDFAYNREVVLKDFSLKVNQGETIGIVGHTGSGKTTLMNILMKFYPILNGSVTIDGVDLKTINDQYLRDQIAIVLQTPLIMEGTLKDNVVMGYTFSDEAVIEVIKEVGAYYLIERHELGIHQLIDQKNLSTGEKQLIAFARALIKNPKLLILDEASANIDSESEVLIQNGIEKLSKNRTTFIIAHRLSTLMNANQIIVLDKGKLVEKGAHQSLIELGGIYYEYMQKQQV